MLRDQPYLENYVLVNWDNNLKSIYVSDISRLNLLFNYNDLCMLQITCSLIWNTCIYNLRIVNDLYDACNNQCVFIMIPVCQINTVWHAKTIWGPPNQELVERGSGHWSLTLAKTNLLSTPLFHLQDGHQAQGSWSSFRLKSNFVHGLIVFDWKHKKWHAVKIVSVNDNLSYEWLTFGLKS